MFELELPLTFLKHHSRPVTSISRRSSKEDACRAEVIAIAENAMGCPLPDANVTVVRDVSPHKLMLCLAFQVPDAVAWRRESSTGEEGTTAARAREMDDRSKRLRTSA